MKGDLTVHAALRHRFHGCDAEPVPLGRRHGWPLAFGPAHAKDLALGLPANVDTTPVRRERPVLHGVGGKLVDREPDGLRGGRLQDELGATHGNTRTDKVREGRELSMNQVFDINSLPLVPNEQVLIG